LTQVVSRRLETEAWLLGATDRSSGKGGDLGKGLS
jgi:hypothetical protein